MAATVFGDEYRKFGPQLVLALHAAAHLSFCHVAVCRGISSLAFQLWISTVVMLCCHGQKLHEAVTAYQAFG